MQVEVAELPPVPRPRVFPAEGGDQAPGPRCGHTLTTITGPDGDINRAKLVLFGGATALEGSTAKNPDGTTSSPASPSPAGIRLAGATNDVHVFDVRAGRWSRVQPAGEPPSPRAAHAAAAVGNMVVVQGGIGPAGLATEDLHVLDFTDPDRPRWHRVLVHGAGPSARYAHTLSLVANRFLVALGGNDGRATLGDAWALDTSEKPYAWRKITDAGEMPCARMYATAAARSDGLLLLCGGRDASGVPLADAHGFARHRDGRWEWHAAPGQMPSGRYQHGAVFVGARLHVSGGAVGGGRMVEEGSSVVALDTSGGAWCLPPAAAAGAAAAAAGSGGGGSGGSGGGSGGSSSEDPARRCRHAAASVGPFVFLYGGLRGSALLDDLLLADDAAGTELACCDPRSAPWSRYLTQAHGSASAAALLAEAAAAEAAAAEALRERSSGSLAEEGGSPAAPASTARGGAAAAAAGAAATTAAAAAAAAGGAVTPISTARAAPAAAGEAATPTAIAAGAAAAGAVTPAGAGAGGLGIDARDASPDGVTLLNHWRPPPPGGTPPTPDVRLYHRAVVAPMEPPLRGLVRQLSIDQLDNEGRRVSIYGEKGSPGPGGAAAGAFGGAAGAAGGGGGSDGGENGGGIPARSPLFSRSLSVPGAHKRVISELLRPRQWRPSPDGDRRFMLGAEEIVDLCEAAERLFADEPSVLELRAPVKIFGDLHGQFGDLMRLFEEYGAPNTAGDITYIDYLFLGDYVDRGSHSLETICLLLALKVEYPRHVHLIRGNHEAADINALFGFRLECLERLGDEDGIWVWKRVNALFNWLPLAALIEGKVLCMHGGIGRCIHRVEQIAELKRPLTMEDGGPVLMDLLWSDPTTNDGVEGVQPSPRGPGLVTFGPDRVKEFCRDNGLQMIVRAHECVMDGFERFAQGHLITLFSATNYCGTAGNAGAILVLGRDLVMVPKLIHPVPPATPRTPDSAAGADGGDALLAAGAEGDEGGEGGGGGAAAAAGADTWMTQVNEERPPTPPRGRPHSPGSSLEYF